MRDSTRKGLILGVVVAAAVSQIPASQYLKVPNQHCKR
jgi:hypothetical protein